MQKLNLPDYTPRIRQGGDRQEIFCLTRKKYVALTPEEWVRQHLLNLFISHLSYPRGMIRAEHSISYFKKAKRSDITLLDTNGDIFLLAECKSYQVSLTQATASQVATYNKVLQAPFIAISNGLKHFVWQQKGERHVPLKAFPDYPSSTE